MSKYLAVLFALFNLCVAKPLVSVAIPATAYFVDKIADKSLEINILLPDGSEPHTYEPKASKMKELAKSDILFTQGLEFEKILVEKAASLNSNLSIVDLTQNLLLDDDDIKDVKDLKARVYDEHEIHKGHIHHESHEHHDEHEAHEHSDPHFWLDPVLVVKMVETIYHELCKKYPQNIKMYQTNKDKFIKELNAFDDFITRELRNTQNNSFLVYHPSYGYFARRYELEQFSIEQDGKEPKPKHLANLSKIIKDKKIKFLIVSPSDSIRITNSIAEQLGVKKVFINPLSKDWKNTIETLVKIIKEK